METPPVGRADRIAGLFILFLVLASLVAIPLLVLSQGYSPVDDANRHVAKVFADRPWDRIVVFRPGLRHDHTHVGWDAILRLARATLAPTKEELLEFSVVASFLLVFLPAVFLPARPEALLAAFLWLILVEGTPLSRLLYGRPFAATMGALLVILLLHANTDRFSRRTTGVLTFAVVAAATWIHSSWFFFLFPALAFLATGRWRTALDYAAAAVPGILAGAILSGAPLAVLAEAVSHQSQALGENLFTCMLVKEFQPNDPLPLYPLTVFVLLAARARVPPEHRPQADPLTDPALVLAIACYALGFRVGRFWYDIGVPAFLAWMTTEIGDHLRAAGPRGTVRYAAAVTVLCAGLVLAGTADSSERYSKTLKQPYPVRTPENADWFPDRDGTFYNLSMRLFYGTFFHNPTGDWRYLLGFEPAMMPAEERAILDRYLWNNRQDEILHTWAAEMRPGDRLLIFTPYVVPVPGIEWKTVCEGVSIGRPVGWRAAREPPATPSHPGHP
ncbi:MAG: hypothetical protein GX442_08615 [Candidatus Riflebacteria bacterium]|nr:hypothetical protein [Candidatus Riflebacteria bacterium]